MNEAVAQTTHYAFVSAADVSPTRRHIANEVVDRAIARFVWPCPTPTIQWFREASATDGDFVEDRPIAGQVRKKWDEDAARLLVSVELTTVEDLVRTVAHEMKHVYQLAHFRPPIAFEEYAAAERDAHRFERLVWNDWVSDHGEPSDQSRRTGNESDLGTIL